jgi:excisionase family DNA binding protein
MTSNGLSVDELIGDPAKATALSPEAAQALLIGLASIQPLLIQRALIGPQGREGEDGLLTVPQVAAKLKLSPYRTYELCRQGHLKSIHLGKAVRVKPSDLAAYVAQQGG